MTEHVERVKASEVWLRLRWALKMKRRPLTVGGHVRLLWHDFVTHGLFGPGGERCQDCGHDYPLWHAEGDLWERVRGTTGGLLCLSCFDRQARDADLNDKEREALEEIERIYGEGRKPPTNVERRIHEVARAALAAREEAVPVELQRHFLNDAEFHTEVELARHKLLANGSAVTTETVILVVDALLAAREDTERPDEICGVVCACGPNGEPMACGYEHDHDGAHSWASLPTWTDRWRIVHHPAASKKGESMAIEGPPTDSRIVYGVAMDRGVPLYERVRDTEQEHEGND